MDVETIRNKVMIVRVSGEIDYSNAGKVNDALEEAVRESPQGFVVDLSGVTYMDSAGVQALLGTYRSLWEAKGSIALVVTHPNIIEILDVLSAGSLPRFFICQDIDSAKKALSVS